jgi:hypothetical protein
MRLKPAAFCRSRAHWPLWRVSPTTTNESRNMGKHGKNTAYIRHNYNCNSNGSSPNLGAVSMRQERSIPAADCEFLNSPAGVEAQIAASHDEGLTCRAGVNKVRGSEEMHCA